MKTIVLSGFGPFGGYPRNSSEIVAKMVDRKVLGGFEIRSKVFPACVPEAEHRGAILLYEACSMGAVGIVALGMASEKRGLCVETVAANEVNSLKYCPPEFNGKPIDDSRPLGEKVAMPVGEWNVEKFRSACRSSKIPVMGDSTDAGGFCCNHLAYQLVTARKSSESWMKIPFIFIHIPCSSETVTDLAAFRATGKITMSVNKVMDGLRILLAGSALATQSP